MHTETMYVYICINPPILMAYSWRDCILVGKGLTYPQKMEAGDKTRLGGNGTRGTLVGME